MPSNYITLSQLTKTTKGLVNKINAEQTVTNNKIGDLTNLNTTAKTNLVAAINEAAASGGSGTSYDDTALAGRVTALENAGYITSYTETDPTVPAWAKQATKPTYTAAEVGALPDTTVIPAAQVQSDWNATTGIGVILNKPDTSTFMVKGIDYVTAGQKSGTTLGTKATAEGYNTTASGYASHAEGISVTASANYSHAEGSSTTASGYASHVEGESSQATTYYSHAEGRGTKAEGLGAHAEGGWNLASNDPEDMPFDEAIITKASGPYSHAEGGGTLASKAFAHSEGDTTTASGISSHSEGNNTTASAQSSHAEGNYTIASGIFSHAEGSYTTAQRKSQHVFGEYNILDTQGSSTGVRGQYVEIVGNGTNSSTLSNARTLDWSGNEVLAGKLTIGIAPTNNMDVATKQYVDNTISSNATTITNTLASGTLIATINGTNIYAPAYTDADGVSY